MGRSPLLQISSSVTPKLHWSAALPIGAPLSTHSGAIHGIRSRRSAMQNSVNKNERSYNYLYLRLSQYLGGILNHLKKNSIQNLVKYGSKFEKTEQMLQIVVLIKVLCQKNTVKNLQGWFSMCIQCQQLQKKVVNDLRSLLFNALGDPCS